MEHTRQPWSRTWWGIVLIIFGIYIVIRIFMVFIFSSPTPSSSMPWSVTLTGDSNAVWQGGCETYTTNGSSDKTITVMAPWSAHYPAADNSVNCYFQNQEPSGSGTVTIRYDGQVVGSAQASGPYAILSTVGEAP